MSGRTRLGGVDLLNRSARRYRASVPLPATPPAITPAAVPPASAPTGRAAWWPRYRRALGLAAGLLIVGYSLDQAPRLDADLLERLANGPVWSGVAVYLGLGTLICAVGLPRQTAAFAAGYALAPRLGLGPAVVLSLCTQLAGCVVNFVWARWLAGAWVMRRLPPRLRGLDGRLSGQPFRATLALRLLPLGSNIALNLLGGLSTVRLAPFLAASAIGYLPQTLIFAMLGNGMQVGRWAELGMAAGLFIASGLLGAGLMVRRPSRPPVSAE